MQHGGADAVVRAMNVKYKKWRFGRGGSCNSGISDHIAHPTPHAKFAYNRFKRAWLRMREIHR